MTHRWFFIVLPLCASHSSPPPHQAKLAQVEGKPLRPDGKENFSEVHLNLPSSSRPG